MLEFSEKRNRDFYKACCDALGRSYNRHRPVGEIVREVAESPAPGYYVSYYHATRKLRRYSSPGKESRKRERMAMWREIEGKVTALMQSRGMRRYEAIAHVLSGATASSFFMAPRTAMQVFNRMRHYRK